MQFSEHELSRLTDAQLSALRQMLAETVETNALNFYKPYPKQREFHSTAGPLHIRERLLKAGNQVGKTWSAGFEHAMHLTGRYPDWWCGVVFDEPVIGWAASETGQGTRDTVQRILLGQIGAWGTGAIPRDAIREIKRAPNGVPDLVETVLVKHGGGGDVQAKTSRVTIKTYDQGRLRWQGETLDFVWFDEEPPEDIYFEGLTRTNARGGIVTLTFTPLKGMSEVVRRFLQEKPAGTVVTNMTIHDAAHYTPEQRAAIIATYPAHEKEARINGTPTLGSGRIFPIADEVVQEDAVPIPAHWPRIGGMDFGWDHPTAAVWIAWDRDNDTVHLYDAYRVREATPLVHSLAIKARGQWIPMAWPHDGLQHDKGSGEELAKQYRKHGVSMLKDKATHAPDPKKGQKEGEGGNGVEAGLMDMLDRMQTGRLKVARHLHDWFEEFRLYHREDGKVVKVNDDLMSATRYALMMLRHSRVPKPEPSGPKLAPPTIPNSTTGAL
jgi:phage terminase large subunit-like protein